MDRSFYYINLKIVGANSPLVTVSKRYKMNIMLKTIFWRSLFEDK